MYEVHFAIKNEGTCYVLAHFTFGVHWFRLKYLKSWPVKQHAMEIRKSGLKTREFTDQSYLKIVIGLHGFFHYKL